MIYNFNKFISYFDAVSGTSPYESWIYTSYNLVLGLPIIFFGILDRDISADFALANPSVILFYLSYYTYIYTYLFKLMNIRSFIIYI